MSLQLPQDRLDAIVARHAAASAEINTATEATRVVELSREHSELGRRPSSAIAQGHIDPRSG